MMNQFLLGMIAMGLFVVSVFFLRFWKDTRDRLFGILGLAFLLLGVSRVVLALINSIGENAGYLENAGYIYVIRLVAFLLILLALLDKNFFSRRG